MLAYEVLVLNGSFRIGGNSSIAVDEGVKAFG